jgi:hypothetical protein
MPRIKIGDGASPVSTGIYCPILTGSAYLRKKLSGFHSKGSRIAGSGAGRLFRKVDGYEGRACPPELGI